MAEFVRSLQGWALRLGFVMAWLVFFFSLMAAGLLLLALWLLRALWAKVTGQPVRPWVFQMSRRPPWQQAHPGSGAGRAPASADVIDAEARDVTVVTDVEPKRPDSSR